MLLFARNCVLCLLFFTLPAVAAAAEPQLQAVLNFSQTQPEHELRRYGPVTSIVQDKAGTLWLGSRAGLLKYNGQSIQRLDSNKYGLFSDTVFDLAIDQKGALWALTQGFVLHKQKADQSFSQLQLAQNLENAGFAGAKIYAFAGKIWLTGTDQARFVDEQQQQLQPLGKPLSGLVHRYAADAHNSNTLLLITNKAVLYQLDVNTGEQQQLLQLPRAIAPQAMQLRGQQLYILQQKQLLHVDLKTKQLSLLFDLTDYPQFGDALPYYLLLDGDQLWLTGAASGLLRYQLQQKQLHQFHKIAGLANALQDNSTSAIFIDTLQNLWFGTTSAGLYRLPQRHQYAEHFVLASPVAASSNIKPLLQLAEHWLLRDAEQQLWIWPQHSNQLQPVFTQIKANLAAAGSDGRLFLAGSGGFYQSDNTLRTATWHELPELTGQHYPQITALLVQQTQLYLGSYYGLIRYQLDSGKTELLQPPNWQGRLWTLTGLLEDNSGALWLSAGDSGLFRYQPDNNSWQHWPVRQLLHANTVLALQLSPDQQLWLGTDQGAVRLKYQHGTFTITSPLLGQSALSNQVHSLLLQGKQLWLSNGSSLSCYQLDSWQKLEVLTSMGLVDTVQPRQLLANAQHLLVGGASGLSRLALQLPDQQQPPLVRLYFDSLSSASRQLPLTQHANNIVNLSFDERHLQLALGSFSSDDPQKLRYQLRLDEQNHWGPFSDSARFDLYNLRSGVQNLQIRAVSSDDLQPLAELNLMLNIAPPWWRSTPAYLIYASSLFVLLLLGWLDVRQRRLVQQAYLHHLKEKEQQLSMALWGSGDELWDWRLDLQQLSRRNCLPELGATELQHNYSLQQRVRQVYPADAPAMQQELQQLLDGHTELYQCSYRIKTPQQDWIWVLDRGKVTEKDHKGAAIRISGTLQVIHKLKTVELALKQLNEDLELLVSQRTDELHNNNLLLLRTIDELKHTQNELLAVEKMASLGAMVAGLAHEMNTPLGVVITAISSVEAQSQQLQQLKAKQLLSGTQFDQLQQQILSGCQLAIYNLSRMNQLIQMFKKLAVNLSGENTGAVHLAEIWRMLLLQHQPALQQRGFMVQSDIPATLVLESYATAIQDILQELLQNSLQHAKTTKEAHISLSVSYQDGRCYLQYQDSGEPIAEAIRQQMFEPFTTSARPKGNAGLGLSLVFNLVTQLLNGQIQYRSVGQQAWFDISFAAPLSQHQYSRQTSA